eukprot:scpid67314/ scgid16993/ 
MLISPLCLPGRVGQLLFSCHASPTGRGKVASRMAACSVLAVFYAVAKRWWRRNASQPQQCLAQLQDSRPVSAGVWVERPTDTEVGEDTGLSHYVRRKTDQYKLLSHTRDLVRVVA